VLESWCLQLQHMHAVRIHVMRTAARSAATAAAATATATAAATTAIAPLLNIHRLTHCSLYTVLSICM
jgi:hypothetical protein